jgi:hypothetical protein
LRSYVHGVTTPSPPEVAAKNLLLKHTCINCDYHKRDKSWEGTNEQLYCIFREFEDVPDTGTCDKWSDHDFQLGM